MKEAIKIEAIIFDMDGVLFDTENIIAKGWYQSAERFKISREETESLIISSIGLNRYDTKILFEKMLGKDFPYEAFMDDVRAIFKETLKRDGLPVKEGVYEILEFLDKSSYKIALASSSTIKSVMGHLEESNLAGYFSVIIGGDMVKHSKPNPDIYLMACEALGVRPENSIAIEDSPNGIKAAYAAGMKPIMVPDMVQPDDTIRKMLYQEMSSLTEVKNFLKKTPSP